jgi:hypothetical protein
MSLAGTWQAVMGGWASNQPVTLPGKAQGHHFVKDVAVPSAWQGKSVYVHVRNSPGIRPPVYGMGNGLIFVNGQPITIFSLFHKQNAPEDTVNLTPYIKCGETNRIELWPQFAQKDPGKEYNFAIETIEMAAKSNEKAPMTP